MALDGARRSRLRWLWLCGEALVVVAPGLPLLRLSDSFATDWYNHSWMIAYYAEYFRRHVSVPIVMNTVSHAGIPTPIFYGYLFFPVAGVVAALLGPALALRVLAFGAFAAEYLLVRSTLLAAGAERLVAVAIGAMVVWAVYPLTNLYNRAALPEFFAVAALTAATMCWFQCLLATTALKRASRALASTLFFALAAGFHPITAMLGTLFFVPLVLSTGVARRAWPALAAVLPGFVLAGVVLYPWASVVHELGPLLRISQNSIAQWSFYPTIDTLLVRLVPYDTRMNVAAVHTAVSTPYLDATMNTALVAMFAVVLLAALRQYFRSREGGARSALVIGAVTLFFVAALLCVTLSPAAADQLPAVLRLAQFPYRLVSELDLIVLSGAVALFVWSGRKPRVSRPLVVACMALSASYLAVKWRHVEAVRNEEGANETAAHVQRLPFTFTGFTDYQIRRLYRDLIPELFKDDVKSPIEAKFIPLTGQRFGELDPLTVKLARAGWVGTNVQPFPWTSFLVDGIAAAPGDLRIDMVAALDVVKNATVHKNRLVAVRVPAGTHVLEVREDAPIVWLWSRHAAFAVLWLWIAASVTLWFLAARRWRRETP